MSTRNENETKEQAVHRLFAVATESGLRLEGLPLYHDLFAVFQKDEPVGLVEIYENDAGDGGGYFFHTLPLDPKAFYALTALVRKAFNSGVALHRTARGAILRLLAEANDDTRLITRQS